LEMFANFITLLFLSRKYVGNRFWGGSIRLP
jgi:hypothetical protein